MRFPKKSMDLMTFVFTITNQANTARPGYRRNHNLNVNVHGYSGAYGDRRNIESVALVHEIDGILHDMYQSMDIHLQKKYGSGDLFVYQIRQTCENSKIYFPIKMHLNSMNICIQIAV